MVAYSFSAAGDTAPFREFITAKQRKELQAATIFIWAEIASVQS